MERMSTYTDLINAIERCRLSYLMDDEISPAKYIFKIEQLIKEFKIQNPHV